MSELSTRILEHMAIVASDGTPVGTVDRVDGIRIKLTRGDNPQGDNGRHRYLPVTCVAAVEGGEVRLSITGDEARRAAEEPASSY